MEKHPFIVEHLLVPFQGLMSRLGSGNSPLAPDSGKQLFFLAFDEISTVLVHNKPVLLTVLRRITRLLKGITIWTFVMSTESPMFHMTPAVTEDPSLRVRRKQLGRIPPFLHESSRLIAS